MMGGGAGSIAAMNQSIRKNRELLRKIKPFDKAKHLNKLVPSRSSNKSSLFKKANKDLLLSIRKRARKQRIINFIKGSLIMVFSISLVAYGYFKLIQTF